MTKDKELRHEEKMERHEESLRHREESMERHREEEKKDRLPWYNRSKIWLYIGVGVACALLLYWVLFLAIWDGPNQ